MNDLFSPLPPPTASASPGAGRAAGSEAAAPESGAGRLRDALRAGRWWILACVLLALLGGQAVAWLTAPVYQSDALLQVEDQKKPGALSAALGDAADALGSRDTTVAELEILRSRMVVGQAARAVGFDTVLRPHYLPVVGEALARHGRRLAPWLANLGGYARGGEQVALAGFAVGPRLQNRAFELVAGAPGRYDLLLGGHPVLAGRVGVAAQATLAADEGTGIRTGPGPSPAAPQPVRLLVQRLDAAPGTRFELRRLSDADAAARITDHLTVAERGKQSGVIGLTFQDADPELAQRTLNRILDAYQNQNVDRRSADAAQTLAFLREQLPRIKQSVEQAEGDLRNYQVTQRAPDLPEETAQILKQQATLEAQTLELSQKREALLAHFTDTHPSVVALDQQLAQTRAALGGLTGRIRGLPDTQRGLLSLRRQLEVNTTLYTNLLNSYQELQVSKAGTLGTARIIDTAVLPTRPLKPRPGAILVIAAALGLVLGVGLVLLRLGLYRGLENPLEVERRFGLPILATIPYVREQRRLPRGTPGGTDPTPPLLALRHPDNVAVEGLRSMRTGLVMAMLEARNNVVAITGPTPNVGKSFISGNLAAVLAMADKTTVLIDADLRHGHLQDGFGLDRRPGLGDYMAGEAELAAILRPTAAPSLTLVTGGTRPSNPAELLLSARFRQLLATLSQRFDFVVLDAPPVLAVADAGILGALAGTTIVVLKAGAHDPHSLDEMLRRLRQSGSHVRGVVFNQLDRGAGFYSYTYGYSYQYGSR